MEPEKKDKYPGFCVLPFTSLYGGREPMPCCEYRGEIDTRENWTSAPIKELWHSDQYKTLRKEFYKLRLPKQCSICVKDEQQGLESKRQYSNRIFENQANEYFNNPTLTPDVPVDYDMRLSNYCNLECVMCGPNHSSAIQSRVSSLPNSKDFHMKVNLSPYRNNKEFFHYMQQHIGEVKRMLLAGGEPFLMPDVIEFLKNQAEAKTTSHIGLRILTNGTVFRSQWIQYLDCYKTLDIHISLDAVGDILEYVRYPNKWKKVYNNLKMFKELQQQNDNIKICLNPCVHLLNLTGIHKVLDTAIEFGFHATPSFVYEANGYDYLKISRLKDDVRNKEADILEQKAKTYNKHSFDETFIKSIREAKFDLGKDHKEFQQAINYWDSHKHVKFLDLYPHLDYLVNIKP